MPLSSRLGPSHAHNIERQTLQQYNSAGWKLAIDAKQPNVPLGNTFRTHVVYSVVQTGSQSTELHISGELHFRKQGVSLLRGAIESGWRKGTHKTYQTVEEMLVQAFPEHTSADGAQEGIVAAGHRRGAGQRVAKVRMNTWQYCYTDVLLD